MFLIAYIFELSVLGILWLGLSLIPLAKGFKVIITLC